MPNINVPKKLESIRRDLSRVADHVGEYSGISTRKAEEVEMTATEIAELGVQLAALARAELGDPNPVDTVIEKLRGAVDA